jgi:hypothetical protein
MKRCVVRNLHVFSFDNGTPAEDHVQSPFDNIDSKNSTRRGFVQNITAGAAGIALVGALTSLSTPVLAIQEAKPKIPRGGA